MTRFIAVLIVTLIVAFSLDAQERLPPASSVMPAGYLQAMPLADRVLSDMKVADSVDTRARQVVAMSDLEHILIDLTADHEFRPGLTPDEKSLRTGYSVAWNRLFALSANVPGLTALMNRYSADDSNFHKQLLDRYFSPAWQNGLVARERQIADRESARKRASDSTARADSLEEAEASRPFVAISVPPAERRFAAALTKWCRSAPERQSNPLADQKAGEDFMLRLRPIINSAGPIKDWTGTLLAITPGIGDATVTITVDTVASYRGGTADADLGAAAIFGASFSSGTAAYADASRVEVGQRVFFSGRGLTAASQYFFSNNEGEGCRVGLSMELTAIRR